MGTLLKHYRISLNLSRAELASKANISRKYLSKIECNLSFPPEPVLKRISKVLNICPYELLNFCDNCYLENCTKPHFFLPNK